MRVRALIRTVSLDVNSSSFYLLIMFMYPQTVATEPCDTCENICWNARRFENVRKIALIIDEAAIDSSWHMQHTNQYTMFSQPFSFVFLGSQGFSTAVSCSHDGLYQRAHYHSASSFMINFFSNVFNSPRIFPYVFTCVTWLSFSGLYSMHYHANNWVRVMRHMVQYRIQYMRSVDLYCIIGTNN